MTGQRVITPETSSNMRSLMRLVVSKGTGRKANIQGYLIGGKTGTAEKTSSRGYSKSSKMVSFVGAFPMNAPLYALLVTVDEPIGNKRTFNYATGGWVAAPVVGKVVDRIGTMLGIAPNPEAAISLPQIKLARTKHTVHPEVRETSWEKSVALAVSGKAGRQSAAEERMVIRTRKALHRAVSTSEAHRPIAETLRSTLERKVVAR